MSDETKTIMEEQEEATPEKSIEIEKLEEQKLKSKFPGISVYILEFQVGFFFPFSNWGPSPWRWWPFSIPAEETWKGTEVF